MKYFCIMIGLRGCYMPDDSYYMRFATRRDLKKHLESVYDSHVQEGPARRRYIASVAAAIWRRSHKDHNDYLSTVLPFPPDDHSGILVNPISWSDYVKYLKETGH